MKFIVVHARNVRPSRKGLWFVHEHSASFTAMAMTEESWKKIEKKPASDVLKWQTGPRWGVVQAGRKMQPPKRR